MKRYKLWADGRPIGTYPRHGMQALFTAFELTKYLANWATMPVTWRVETVEA